MTGSNPNIASKILRSGLVEWRNFSFLQPDSFKAMTEEDVTRLRASILENGFVESFKVWESGKRLYCLDGYHRCQILRQLADEGIQVPAKFHADFLDCRSRKDAAKLVLIYSSRYARITDEGLYEFAERLNVDISEIAGEISIPDIDIEKFLEGWGKDTGDDASGSDSGDASTYGVIVRCDDEAHQQKVLRHLTKLGYEPEAL